MAVVRRSSHPLPPAIAHGSYALTFLGGGLRAGAPGDSKLLFTLFEKCTRKGWGSKQRERPADLYRRPIERGAGAAGAAGAGCCTWSDRPQVSINVAVRHADNVAGSSLRTYRHRPGLTPNH